ncbi:hypothetical protein DIPPA_13709 [Diplonema papillatum]|nr:hypothetical protein DIPPA_13709 [Diplonema papillatum]
MGCGASNANRGSRYRSRSDEASRSELLDADERPCSAGGTRDNNVNTTVASLLGTNADDKHPTNLTSPVSARPDSPTLTDDNRDPSVASDEDEQTIQVAYARLLHQAIESARTNGAASVKVAGITLSSLQPPVELSQSDLSRVRLWADFQPPFEPIPVLDASSPTPRTTTSNSSSGKAPRDYNLQQNQDLLDNWLLQKRTSKRGG